MKKLFFFSFCLIISLIATAQNPILISSPDSLKLDKDYNQLIPSELSNIVDANVILKGGLNAFMRDHLTNFSEMSGFPFSIFPANGNFYIMIEAFRDKSEKLDYNAEFEKLKKYFFQNKNFYEALYTALIPLYKDAVHNMTGSESEELLYELQKGLIYAKNFDLEKEKASEEKLGLDFALKKGKLSAFIYRRIANNELTKEECIKWLNKIYTDLSESVKNSGRKEDDYILEGTMISPGYFTARKADDFDGDYQIIKLTKKGYQLLLPENSIILTDFMIMSYARDFQSVLVAHPGGKKEILIFSEDTSKIQSPIYLQVNDIECYPNIKNNFVSVLCSGPNYELYFYEPDGYGKLKLSRYNFEKAIKDLFVSESFACIKYEDNTSEILYFTNESGKRLLKSYIPKYEVKFYFETEKGEYTIINYENDKSELIYLKNNKPEIISLAQNLDSYTTTIWNGYIITQRYTSDSKELNSKILGLDGKVIFDGLDHILSSDSIDFLAVSQNGKYTLYDRELKAFAKGYEAPINQYNNQKEENHYLGSDSKALILTKYEYKKGNIKDSKTVVYDRNGKHLIPEKWPYLKRIYFYDWPMDYYAVCNKVKYSKNTMKIVGKYALFNSEGKQLTKFVYDEIIDTMGGNGYLDCKRDGISVKLDTEGKELK